jgi:hypothetical protein
MMNTSRRKLIKKLWQTGKTNLESDAKRAALPPGRRISASGKKYTETRRNRSDLSRKNKI